MWNNTKIHSKAFFGAEEKEKEKEKEKERRSN
jgi:hypothetical protein